MSYFKIYSVSYSGWAATKPMSSFDSKCSSADCISLGGADWLVLLMVGKPATISPVTDLEGISNSFTSWECIAFTTSDNSGAGLLHSTSESRNSDDELEEWALNSDCKLEEITSSSGSEDALDTDGVEETEDSGKLFFFLDVVEAAGIEDVEEIIVGNLEEVWM